jgi:hypothetical protein
VTSFIREELDHLSSPRKKKEKKKKAESLTWIFGFLFLNPRSNQGVNLPESPFASAIGSGISTVI